MGSRNLDELLEKAQQHNLKVQDYNDKQFDKNHKDPKKYKR